MLTKVKRTYGSRSSKQAIPSSPPSELLSSPPVTSRRKRPLEEQLSFSNISPTPKRVKVSETSKAQKPKKATKKQQALTQLHFSIDSSILRTCAICDLSYTKGAIDDEELHRTHCARVQKGMEWGRDEEKEKLKAGVVEVGNGIRLKDGKRGRIIYVRADVGGKIGSKLTSLLKTINLALSSPPLAPSILQASKAYLFLIPASPGSKREKIIGCVIAQRITTAMAIAPATSSRAVPEPATDPFMQESHTTVSATLLDLTTPLIAVDTTTGIFCYPTPLPTPMGIPRLFVSLTHRRQGIASKLLSAAAATFIHGCPLDPRKGEVAFTQPTGDGNAVMHKWGGNEIRIYEE